jgi:NAD-dependent dihydropyrimidine dehydrogenase PreA subunit
VLRRLDLSRANTLQRMLVGGVTPTRLDSPGDGGPLLVRYSDGTNGVSACVRCSDAPCLRFGQHETQLNIVPSFPSDGDTAVCPTDAITWSLDADSGPWVDKEKCIGCGLCVQRCPVGAISLGSDGLADVNDQDTPQLASDEAANAFATRERFVSVPRDRRISEVTDVSLDRFVERAEHAIESGGSRFPNLLSRNLLLGSGWIANIRRAGDTNVRLDLVAERKGRLVTAEIEYSDAAIDAPRSVLDSLAVIRNRHGVKPDLVTGMVLVWTLPNQRSEYWRVLGDIENVIGVRISTLTAPALACLVWQGTPLEALPTANHKLMSIRATMEANLGRSVEVTIGLRAVLEAQK